MFLCVPVQVTLESAIQDALNLEIEEHSHSGEEPYPPFPSKEALALAFERSRKRKIHLPTPIQKRTGTTLKPEYLQDSDGDMGASTSHQPVRWHSSPPNATTADSSEAPAALPELMKEHPATAELTAKPDLQAEEVCAL